MRYVKNGIGVSYTLLTYVTKAGINKYGLYFDKGLNK